MAMFGRLMMLSYSLKLAGWDYYPEFSGDYQRKRDNPFARGQSSSGMRGKLACAGGPTGRAGAQAESRAAS